MQPTCFDLSVFHRCFWLPGNLFFDEWDFMITFLCSLNSLKYFTCQPGKLKKEFTSPIINTSSPGLLPGHYSLCTLFKIVSWNLNFNKTFTLKYETHFLDELVKYLYKWVDEVVYLLLSFLHKQHRDNYSRTACNYLLCVSLKVIQCLK